MRTYQHIIDTRSVKRVLNLLPEHWVIRELTERDYGIDLIVEVFEEADVDSHGHTTYESTGAVFHIQVKGTNSGLSANSDGNISYSLSKSALTYSESFSAPFLLFRVDVSSPVANSYFVWIQRYIKDVLDLQNPKWRTDSQDSFSIYLPQQNEVTAGLKKIERIASRPKYIQELVEFREYYFHLSSQLSAASIGQFVIDDESLKHMRHLARQIFNLRTIYKYNNCCIDKGCVSDLLDFVESLTISSRNSDFSGSPHQYNFSLLSDSIEGISDIENFIAENDSDTVY